MAEGFNFGERMLRTLFDDIDKDGNGKLDKDEFSELMERQGHKLSWREFERLFASVDTDGSGEIDFEEFKEAMGSMSNEPNKHRQVRKIFQKYDRDSKGSVSLNNLLKVMRELKLSTGGDDVITALKMAGAGGPVKYDTLVSKFANSLSE